MARMDRHATELEEIDVEGILGFAERVLPRAAELWVQVSLEQRQRLQQLFFPEGIAFDGNRSVRTAVTAPAFNWLPPEQPSKTRLEKLISGSRARLGEPLRATPTCLTTAERREGRVETFDQRESCPLAAPTAPRRA